jgi:lysophospholipase L1-like esterase
MGAAVDEVTYSLKIEAEAPYEAVALLWQNYEATEVAGCKALVGSTNTFSTASQASRYQTNWQSVTWSGSNSVTIPAGSQAAPGIAVSDLVPLNSVTRTDGTRPLLLIRSYFDGASSLTYTEKDYNGNYNTPTARNRNRVFDVGQFAGDAITNTSNTIIPSIRTALVSPIFRYTSNVTTIAFIGDSITQGSGSTSGLDNWGRRACYDLGTPEVPIVPCNLGMSAQTSTTYLAHALAIMAITKPSIAFYFPYSPNDGIDSSVKLAAAMDRTDEFLSYCSSNNIVPVLCTPVPNNNLTSTNDAFRKQAIATIKSYPVAIADFAVLTGNGATPERWITGFNADALHPNDYGYEAMSTVARQVIRQILS